MSGHARETSSSKIKPPDGITIRRPREINNSK